MNGGYVDADGAEEEEGPARKQKRRGQPSSSKQPRFDPNKRCNRCLEIGHARKTSRLCRFYKLTTTTRKKKPTESDGGSTRTPQQSDADELDKIDAMPLVDNEAGSNSSGSNDFFDARDYCSSDEDDDLTRSDMMGGSTEI